VANPLGIKVGFKSFFSFFYWLLSEIQALCSSCHPDCQIGMWFVECRWVTKWIPVTWWSWLRFWTLQTNPEGSP
jgi:hypothetical protein